MGAILLIDASGTVKCVLIDTSLKKVIPDPGVNSSIILMKPKKSLIAKLRNDLKKERQKKEKTKNTNVIEEQETTKTTPVLPKI